MIACGDAAGARGERRQLEHAHRAVPEDGPRVGEPVGEQLDRLAGRCPGPSSRPGSRRRRRPRCRRRPRTRARPRRRPAARARRRARRPRRGTRGTASTWSASSSESPTSWPCAARNVKHIPPPTSRRSTVPQQVLDDAELVGDLRRRRAPRRTAAAGRAVSRSQHLDLGQHQAAGGVRQQPGDVVHAGLLAVHDAEAVADVQRRRGRPAGRRTRPARRRPCSSRAASKRRFSSSATSPSPSAATVSCADGPTTSVGERHRAAEQLAEPVGDRRAASSSGRTSPFGRPRCAHTTTRAPAVGERADGRDAGPDAAVVGDRLVPSGPSASGTFRSDADQHPPPGDVEVVECCASRRR